jgi:hypothetical protein
MVTSNAIQRTVHIRYADQIATAFFIDVDSRQYLVTARHVVPDLQGEAFISILHNNDWHDVGVRLVGHAPGEADISVLALPYRIAGADLTLPPDAAGLTVGQEAFFLGFPFGLFGEMGAANNHYPLPFVKRATVSCFEHNQHGLHRIFLDGNNNLGFSGGPVVFCLPGTNELRVAGVISGYRYEDQPIFHGTELLPLSTRHNTGIIFSYGIGYATSLARGNPIGSQ